MPDKPKYLFVAFPSSITPSGHKDDAMTSIQKAVKADNGDVFSFNIPIRDLKVGTLDGLIQQSEELGRIENLCKGVVAKVGDTLRNVLGGDEEKMAMHKTVNDKPLDQYLKSFSWNKVKYRPDKPLSELVNLLQKEANSIDNDIRSKFSQYNNLRTSLTNTQRKATGNLSTKSLTALISPDMLLSDSEHLETHLVAVPLSSQKDFQRSYETMSQMVVPRSAYHVASDSEFALYTVAVFKKHASEFVHKCREKKWVPRDFKFKEGGREEEVKEERKLEAEEKRVWGETLRLGRTGWSEGVMCLIHVICLRVFVESVLRYGLPLDFVTSVVQTDTKRAEKARKALDAEYGYLAGNAFGRDKKGRIQKDQGMSQNDMMGVGGEAGDYSPYVSYDVEID